ncbi:trans-2,3-enoyl-CoA reductase-like isoform X3 [Lissotriton helveticus]
MFAKQKACVQAHKKNVKAGVAHSNEQKSFLALSQFVLSAAQLRSPPVLRHSKIPCYEVEILDAQSRKQICVVDKVHPLSTLLDIKHRVHQACPEWYPSRIGLRQERITSIEGPFLRDTISIQDVAVSSIVTLYFTDLGQQVSWTTVFLSEYSGPLLIYLLFYVRVSGIYDTEESYETFRHPVVQAVPSIGDLPLVSPTTSIILDIHLRVCEAGNHIMNVALVHQSVPGSRACFPSPTYNPFTWLSLFVTCPNYTYEIGSWVSFTIMTQTLPVGVFASLMIIQMAQWAKRKHRIYQRKSNHAVYRKSAIIPFLL